MDKFVMENFPEWHEDTLIIEKYSGENNGPRVECGPWARIVEERGSRIWVRIGVEKRINDIAEQQLKEKFVRFDFSFKGQFCYIDAFTEPAVDENWDEKILQETREEHIERMRNSPLHLCRLRYFDKEKWGLPGYSFLTFRSTG